MERKRKRDLRDSREQAETRSVFVRGRRRQRKRELHIDEERERKEQKGKQSKSVHCYARRIQFFFTYPGQK